MQILVAEDEPIARAMLESFIASLGHDPVLAEDGEQAWTVLADLLASPFSIGTCPAWTVPKCAGACVGSLVGPRSIRFW